MDLQSIYISNGVGIFILLMLRYTSRTKIHQRKTEDKIYAFMIFGVMLACFMEAFSYSIDGVVFPGSRFLNYVANTYLFSVNLLLPFCLLVYIELSLYEDYSRIWRCYKPQIIIAVLMFGVNIVNFFVPISYYITPENVYERRPLSYVYYFVILYYCLSALILTKRYEREYGSRVFFSVGMFLFPILVGAGLQFMFYGLSLAWLSAAIGLVGLYMMQQNELAYIDPLVDTYNRQYLNQLLSGWTARRLSFAGVMLDIDSFKSINDNYGHSEGDRALRRVTDILKKARREKEWVFRFAGDEFIVLELTDNPKRLSAYMERVENAVKAYNQSGPLYPLSLSYGMSFFETGDIDDFMKEMDSRMYEMKALHHASLSAE